MEMKLNARIMAPLTILLVAGGLGLRWPVGEYHIVSNYQDFVTPSGTAHVRDN
jgi:hypothetical protein